MSSNSLRMLSRHQLYYSRAIGGQTAASPLPSIIHYNHKHPMRLYHRSIYATPLCAVVYGDVRWQQQDGLGLSDRSGPCRLHQAFSVLCQPSSSIVCPPSKIPSGDIVLSAVLYGRPSQV